MTPEELDQSECEWIVWVWYGDEGWQPFPYKTLHEAVRAVMGGGRSVPARITRRPVKASEWLCVEDGRCAT